jgi:F-type H+-transporting ATPase subunit delta
LLKSPIINTGKKLVILEAVFKGNLHEITLAFLMIMVRKNREAIIPEIAAKLDDIYKEYKNILTVHFASPVTPDETVRKQVLALMEKYTLATIDLKTEINESLIGGFVIRWKDKQYDASIKREIENLRNAIAKINLFKKGF